MDQLEAAIATGAHFEGTYEVLSTLGRGGFGVVYKARQLTTGQAVALKVMRPVDLADAARTARRAVRFRREMDLCAQLHHPNIVHLIDSGQTDDGLLYAVFAFVPGETLADVLAREGMLGMAETRHLMMQVLDALTCAHDLGVVHRDLKPRNIMVQSTGARRNAIVLDLGLGVLVHGEQQAQETRLTETGEALGTPGYAAPEQLRGRDASPRADLFSWGLVLLECLTGRPVYSGISTAEILYAQLSPEPVPIPARLQDHPLGDLLFRVTHKDEAARAVTARALLAELEACDVDRPGMRRASDATAAAGERRQVTALCCTLDGDDEVLAGQLAACAEVVERHGGHVAAALGHALLAYFGYPRAEEDDARRAARAGLAIAAHAGAGAARLGIHTGVVVVGGRTDPAAGLGTGETPGVAARLSAAAAPGTVVVTGETRRLLRDAYLFDAEGVLPRGAGDPPRVYRIRQISTDRETVAIATPASDAAPLIGRDQEMRLLFERWGRSRRGAGQCSLITGEPGIGKSRLARELRAHLADESHTFLAGRSSPEARNIALYPVTDLLGRALGLDRETEAADKIARLEDQVGRHGMDRADAMPLLLPLFGLPGGETYPAPPVSLQRLKELTLATVLGLLLALADERPTLLLLEDLHWSDATTLELVEQLIHEAPSAPMCVVLTARPEFAPPFPTIGLLQLHLGRLERLEVETMVRGLMKGKRLPAEVVERVADRTDGIPLFVEELVRMLSESGVLVERDDRHELVGSLSDAAIPTSLRDLLAARLDRLGRARETAQIAAALGREFDADLLHAVSPHPGAAREDLEVLLGAGLIHRKRRQRDSIMVFRHALIRDAAYDSLPPAARRETHARIATALEERFPAIAQARPDLVAHHLALADRRPHAIPYALRAARAALAHSANVEAIGHAREALGWLGAIDDPRQRAEHELDLNSAITMALMSSKGYGTVEVAAIVQRSQELVDSLGATPHAVPTLWANFMYHHLQNHRAQARGIAERLVGLGRAAGDVGGEVAALPILGQCFYIEGRLEESRAACERAAELYDPAQHRNHALLYGLDSRAYAELTLGLVLWLQGYPEQAMVRGTAAIAWAKELDHATTIALALLYMVGIHHYQGERARALAVTDELVDLVDRYGLSMIKGFGGILRGWASGDAAGAEASLAELRGSGQELGTSYWLSLVAEAEAAQGKHGAAVGRLDECLRYAEETGEMYYVPELYRLKGSYLLRHRDGAADAAEDCFRRSIDTARRLGTRMAELRSALALHALLQPRGRFDESIALLAPVYRSFTEGFTLPELRDARYILAELT